MLQRFQLYSAPVVRPLRLAANGGGASPKRNSIKRVRRSIYAEYIKTKVKEKTRGNAVKGQRTSSNEHLSILCCYLEMYSQLTSERPRP